MTAGFFQWPQRAGRMLQAPPILGSEHLSPILSVRCLLGREGTEGRYGSRYLLVELGALVYLGGIFVSGFCWCHGMCLKSLCFWGVCGFLWSGFGRLFKGCEWTWICVCLKGYVLVYVKWDWGKVTVGYCFYQEGRLIDWWDKVDSSLSQVGWDFIWRPPRGISPFGRCLCCELEIFCHTNTHTHTHTHVDRPLDSREIKAVNP